MRKVTVLASRIEEDCRQNIQTLIRDGKKIAKEWGVDWNAPMWDVLEVFSHTMRSHRSDRKSMNLWFTERQVEDNQPAVPFKKMFGDIVRSFVVLRHQAGNQCFGDQQQVIYASQYISQQIAGRAHDLTKLTNGDLERACDAIAASQAASTAYKLHRFVEEIGGIIRQDAKFARFSRTWNLGPCSLVTAIHQASEKSNRYRVGFARHTSCLKNLVRAYGLANLGRPSYNQARGNDMDVETPDNLCEACGCPTPRIVFDEVHKLLLCGRCREK